MTGPDRPGALVISLDFELHWGLRDHVGREDERYARLPVARQAVVALADLFAARGIRATWATVGFLFASTGEELEHSRPDTRPGYRLAALDPYGEPVGEDERADPQHLAGSLVDLVAATPGQEVGSHTFSHYYCLEPGQTEAEFRADLAAAQALARRRGLRLRSLVLPRNQWNPAYTEAVLDSGFECIRGPQPGWGHHAGGNEATGTMLRRGARILDSYVGSTPPPTTAWDDVRQPSGLGNVPASAFLRPFDPGRRQLDPLRRSRLRSGMRTAARRGRIFHLWWHPHNFSRYQPENLAFLDGLLDEFERLSGSEGMQSLSMGDVVDELTRRGPGPERVSPRHGSVAE